jgi:3,4-dihydroxy-2-butanone 4-phosphate synthase
MKINFGETITQYDGSPVIDQDGKPVTLSTITVNAMSQVKEGMSANDKLRNARLAEKAYDAEECEMTPEEVTIIRAAIGEMYPPLVVLKSFRLLGGEPSLPKAVANG